jgi:hypothetical protein
MSLKNVDQSFKYALGQASGPRLATLTVAVGSVLAAGSLQAATITVTTLDDGFITGECSLRSATYSATQNTGFHGCVAGDGDADIIEFDASLSGNLYLDAAASLETDSSIRVGESVTIRGNGNVTIVGTGDAPVFYAKYNDTLQTERFSIENLTITGGGGDRGGAILARSRQLSIVDSVLIDNVVQFDGGAIWHTPPSGETGELGIATSVISGNSAMVDRGGAIGSSMSKGNVLLVGNDISNNTGAGSGGGVYLNIQDYAAVYVKYNEFHDNQATNGSGGGIAASLRYATVELTGNLFDGNQSYTTGGGLDLEESWATFKQAEITLADNTFSNNAAGLGGGGAAITVFNGGGSVSSPVKFIDIESNNAFTNNEVTSQNGTGGGLFVEAGDLVPVSISESRFADNFAMIGGGASLYVEQSLITLSELLIERNESFGMLVVAEESPVLASGLNVSNNLSIDQGAGMLIIASASDVTVEESGFYSNSALVCGGGLLLATRDGGTHRVEQSIFRDNQAGCGGGIFLIADSQDYQSLTEVIGSELSGNSANSTHGGGIYAQMVAGNTLTISNSTISGNYAAAFGGGIGLMGQKGFRLSYSTVASNQAVIAGGGLYSQEQTCLVQSSLFAGNENNSGDHDIYGGYGTCHVFNSLIAGSNSDFVDHGNNLVDVDPMLLPLADNGGTGGRTHAIGLLSPARDAGAATTPPIPLYDQRGPGFSRIVGIEIDIGAFEIQIAEDKIFSDRFEQP